MVFSQKKVEFEVKVKFVKNEVEMLIKLVEHEMHYTKSILDNIEKRGEDKYNNLEEFNQRDEILKSIKVKLGKVE